MHDDTRRGLDDPLPIRRARADRRTPIGMILCQGGNPVDLSSLTVKVAVDRASGENLVTATEDGVTTHPTYTATPDPGTSKLIHNATPVSNGNQVLLTTDDALPGGLSTDTRYWVTDKRANSFKLAAEEGGEPIQLTDAGSGTLTYCIVGSAQWVPTAAAVAECGKFFLWFIVESGDGKTDHFPVGRNCVLHIVPSSESE